MTEPDVVTEARIQHPPCSGCGQVDDHPRHVVVFDFADDSKNKNFHYDCCVNDSPCGSCQPVLDIAGGARGLDLLPHIQTVRAAEADDLNEGVPPVSDLVLHRKG